jgi:hypothetical protein
MKLRQLGVGRPRRRARKQVKDYRGIWISRGSQVVMYSCDGGTSRRSWRLHRGVSLSRAFAAVGELLMSFAKSAKSAK